MIIDDRNNFFPQILQIRIVERVDDGKPLAQQKVGSNTPCYSIAWSPGGKQLAVAASDNKAYLFNVP